MDKRKRFVVLASHEPVLDPRIDWVAHSAAQSYHVTVIGFEDLTRPSPSFELTNGYSVARLERRRKNLLPFFCWSAKRFFTPQSNKWSGVLIEVLLKAWIVTSCLCLFTLMLLTGGVHLVLRLIHRLVRLPIHVTKRVCERIMPRGWFLRAKQLYLRLLSAKQSCVRFVSLFFHNRLPQLVSFYSNTMLRFGVFKWYLNYFTITTSSLVVNMKQMPAPDLIYCNDLDTLLAGALLKDHFKCALVYDAHEFWAHMDPKVARWELWFWLKLEQKLAPYVDAAYTVNHLLGAEMQAAIGIPYRSLPNCEPIRDAEPSYRAVFLSSGAGGDDVSRVEQEMHSKAKGRIRFLFQGNFCFGRGIEELIRAWAYVDHGRAVLFLRGPDNHHKKAYAKVAADLKLLDDSVFFLDPVRESELIDAAKPADVGIISYQPICLNNRFACPNKTSQYMQAGLAILSNNLDYLKEVLADFQCGLMYDSEYPETLVAAVHRFLDEPGLLSTCKKNAKAKVVEVFNWDVQSRDLFETCNRLLARNTSVSHKIKNKACA
jgi:glycosyltransferase involved in cell wall biosynthesis